MGVRGVGRFKELRCDDPAGPAISVRRMADGSLMRLEDLARDLCASGVGVDETVARLKGNGATIIECVKIVREIESVTLGQAKVIVDASTAWAPRRGGNRRLRSVMADEAKRFVQDDA